VPPSTPLQYPSDPINPSQLSTSPVYVEHKPKLATQPFPFDTHPLIKLLHKALEFKDGSASVHF
jgi:hypothetical protein